MPKIFDYTDYRKFLADYYAQRKAQNHGFSYQSFARQAGFPNKGFLSNVIAGRKNISKTSILRISRAIGFNPREADYFENLVFFNQANELIDRNHFFNKMKSVKPRATGKSASHQLMKDQFEYYSQWHHSAIRSLIDMHPYKGDYKRLAKMLRPQITATKARQSVELLEKLSLIKKGPGGTYKVTDKNITTGNKVTNLAVMNFHKEMTSLANDSLQTLSREKNITGLTMGISLDMYKKICGEIEMFRQRIIEMVSNDADSDRVYQLNFHLFPLSYPTSKEKTDE